MKKSIWKLFLLFSSLYLFGEENFLLFDLLEKEAIFEFGPNVEKPATPCCTFNIALSLMGYDCGILENQNNPIWDFREGYAAYFDSWKAPQDPLSWIKNSCVWYSQILASKLGPEIIQNYLQLFDYGNQDMSGGLSKAWLSSSLKISPKEQVVFLQKILREEIPLLGDALSTAKSLFFIEELPSGWKLFGKTGLGKEEDREIGWFVGWIETEEKCFPFAYNILEEKVKVGQRVPRVKQLLAELHSRIFPKSGA
ncbi:MAG: hypothetical protein Tsb0015_01060 [Simkaniaceae bacterium]